jgi:hypothetical protein
MDLEKIIELAKILAKPYKITTYILAVLLVLSICGNIYLATQEVEVVLEADENTESVINQTQG